MIALWFGSTGVGPSELNHTQSRERKPQAALLVILQDLSTLGQQPSLGSRRCAVYGGSHRARVGIGPLGVATLD